MQPPARRCSLGAAERRQRIARGGSPWRQSSIRHTAAERRQQASSRAALVLTTFYRLDYHVVFGTEYRQPIISKRIRDELYLYLGGCIRAKKGCWTDTRSTTTRHTCLKNRWFDLLSPLRG